MLTRPAFTLVELLVALTLSAIVLGTATLSMSRQQGVAVRTRYERDALSQNSGSTQLFAEHLAAADRDAEDIAPGQASDTAIQLRTELGVSISCATESGNITFTADTARVPFAGLAGSIRSGDSLWWYADTAWRAARVVSTQTVNSGCGDAAGLHGAAVRIRTSASDTIEALTPLRVTRQARFVFYRSGDGSWQLGSRDWSSVTNFWGAAQPIAGPFIRQSGALRTSLRYFDSLRMELPANLPPSDPHKVARIRITTLTRLPGVIVQGDSLRADSIDVALQKHHE